MRALPEVLPTGCALNGLVMDYTEELDGGLRRVQLGRSASRDCAWLVPAGASVVGASPTASANKTAPVARLPEEGWHQVGKVEDFASRRCGAAGTGRGAFLVSRQPGGRIRFLAERFSMCQGPCRTSRQSALRRSQSRCRRARPHGSTPGQRQPQRLPRTAPQRAGATLTWSRMTAPVSS